MNVLVLGATGGTGREIVGAALAKGHEVTALVRSPAVGDLTGVRVVRGDALDEAAVTQALSGCTGVISALGTAVSPFRKVTMLSDATRVLLRAMQRQHVRRLVCITGVGSGDSKGHGGLLYDKLLNPLLLRRVYEDKDRQEAAIRASGLDWVIVRPTMLTNGAGTDRVQAASDLRDVHGGTISRKDTAAFAVAQLDGDEWLHRTPLLRSKR